MKRTALKRKTPLRAKKKLTSTKSRKATKKRSTVANKGYKVPTWFMAIKPGAHGNTPAQKRLWRVISETYREEDWNISPHCPCCGKYLSSWREGQLGHWLRYSLCKGWMKVERVNLAMICGGCNMKDDAITLKRLGEHLQMRYGSDILDYIEDTNNKMKPVKMDDWKIVDFVAKLRPDLVY